MVLLIYVYTLGIAFAYTALSPVFSFTLVSLGGYGLTPKQIAYLLGCGGAGQALFSVVFPYLHKRFGSKGILRWASYSWPVFVATYPLMNFALRRGLSPVAFWILACFIASFGSAVSMSFTSIQLTINDISPSANALGSLNGIGA